MELGRRSWYLLAIILPVIAWIIATAQLAARWDVVHDARPIVLGGSFDASGSAVAVFTDVIQTDRSISCAVTKPKSEEATLQSPPVEISVDYDSTRWHLIAFLDSGYDNMAIACLPQDKMTDSASYAYALVESTADARVSAQFIMWGGLAFGFLIALAIGYVRLQGFKHSE